MGAAIPVIRILILGCFFRCYANVSVRLPHLPRRTTPISAHGVGARLKSGAMSDDDEDQSNIEMQLPKWNNPAEGIKETASRILKLASTPFYFLGSAAAISGILRSQETVRRCFYFWSNAGPIVAHYKIAQFVMDHVTKPEKEYRDKVYERLHDKYSQPSLSITLHLKGLYVKIAQVLSMRPDFVPRQYVELFSTVQDSVPQWPYEEVERLIRQLLIDELGLRWDDVFEEIDHDALGSASIGQCHKAVLKVPWDEAGDYQGGRVVAVKVMHPGAENRFYNDFQVFRWLCRIALPGWKPILDELNRQFMTEFDYVNEANSLHEVRRNMAASPFAKFVTVPQPLRSLCCKHLLVMEMLHGKKLSDDMEERLASAIGGDRQAARHFLQNKRDEFVLGKRNTNAFILPNGNSLVRRAKMTLQLCSLSWHVRRCVDILIDVHGYQILHDGVFNGDPHGGNILQLTTGKIGLIDYGQTRRLNDNERLAIARIVVELSKESMDEHRVADTMREFGFKTKYNNDEIMAKYAKLFFDSDTERVTMGCPTPQLYLLKLSKMDPLLDVPDAAVFVARASYMFRGMGSMINEQVLTAQRWAKFAKTALSETDKIFELDRSKL